MSLAHGPRDDYVVRVDNLAAAEELADVADPGQGFALAVPDDLVPGFRLLLDPFPVTDLWT